MCPQRYSRSRAILVATLPLSAAFTFSRPIVPYPTSIVRAQEPPDAGVGKMRLSDNIIDIAYSFTRMGHASTSADHKTRSVMVLLRSELIEVTRHFSEICDQETISAALEQLIILGLDHDDIVAALAIAQRIAESTSDVNTTIAALLHGALREGRMSGDAVFARFGPEVALLAENCAAMVGLHRDSRDLLWCDQTQTQLGPGQASHLQNMLILSAVNWRVVSLVLVVHGRELENASARVIASASAAAAATALSDASSSNDQKTHDDEDNGDDVERLRRHQREEACHQQREAYVLAREALDVYAPLAARLGMRALKNELEELGFKHLHPAEHALVSAEIESRQCTSKVVLDETLMVLRRALQEDTFFRSKIAKVRFEARTKQPYAVWRKLLKQINNASSSKEEEEKGNDEGQAASSSSSSAIICGSESKMMRMMMMDQVLDQLALRVVFALKEEKEKEEGEEGEEEEGVVGKVVDKGVVAGDDNDASYEERNTKKASEAAASIGKEERELCYHVLNVVHQEWRHLEFRVKDYLKCPKPNGYQSLHTTALFRHHGKVWPFEVQVRTAKMHQVAEWGKAAHAQYKEELEEEEALSTAATHSTSSSSLSQMASSEDGKERGRGKSSLRWHFLVGDDDDDDDGYQEGDASTLSQAEKNRELNTATPPTPPPLPLSHERSETNAVNNTEAVVSAPDGLIRTGPEYSEWLSEELRSTRLYVFMQEEDEVEEIEEEEGGERDEEEEEEGEEGGGNMRVVGGSGGGKKERQSTTIWDLPAGTSLKDAVVWRHIGGGTGSLLSSSSSRRTKKKMTEEEGVYDDDDDSATIIISRLRINGHRVSPNYKLRNGDAVVLSR